MDAKAVRARRRYAHAVLQLAGVSNARLEKAFATIPREDFLPPPPWTVIRLGQARLTEDVAEIYDNVLVAIDRPRGINNGEPALHAAWIDAVAPRPGETVIHVGAGLGYYTAILAELVKPGGRVEAFEYETDLAARAAENLRPLPHVAVHGTSAFGRVLPQADVIYVNASVVAPDVEWLRALNPGGRLIFPWQPDGTWGPTMLVTREPHGFRATALMHVGFIPCSGVPAKADATPRPTETGFAAIRSIRLTDEEAPDESAVAAYEWIWFSSRDIEA